MPNPLDFLADMGSDTNDWPSNPSFNPLSIDPAAIIPLNAAEYASGLRQRTLKAKLTESLSVKDFGAVGDGVSDDTLPINNALIAAAGKTLLFPPGQYKTGKTLRLLSDTTILGYGAEIVPVIASSFDVYTDMKTALEKGGVGVTVFPRPILSNDDPAGGNSNIRIFGLKWTGHADGTLAAHGLMVLNVTGLTVADCETVECLSPIAVLHSTDVEVVGNNIKGYKNCGVDTWTGCQRVIISRNIIDTSDTPDDETTIGILVTSVPTDYSDIPTYNADDYIVTNNIITNIRSHGIWVGGGDVPGHDRPNDTARRVQIRGNLLFNIGLDTAGLIGGGIGIIVERSEDCVVDGNTIVNCGYHGIFARKAVSTGTTYCDRLTISNNTIRNVNTASSPGDGSIIYMNPGTRDAWIYGNRGSGSLHKYAVRDDSTNSGLGYFANRFDTGVLGKFSTPSPSVRVLELSDLPTLPPSGTFNLLGDNAETETWPSGVGNVLLRTYSSNASYRTILDASGSHTAGATANTYGLAQGEAAAITGVGIAYPLKVMYIDPADYPTVAGMATMLRVRVSLNANDVAPGGNFTFGLHPVTRPGTSGGAGVAIYTIGTAISGSTVTATAPAADSQTNVVGADFAVPTAGFYVLGFVSSATVAASSHLHISAALQMRNP